METAITNAFDQQIRRQLDPIWYRVSLRSKQLLNEIKILRVLLEYLLRYDALGFCKFLETLVMADATASSTGGFRSYWLMMDMAHTLIRVAKERVYKVSDKDGSLEAQIERISKWKALEGVLTNSDGKKILIMVHQEHTRRTLTKIISLGYDKWQESKFKEYCQWKRIARDQSGLASGVSVVVDATGPPPPLRRRSKPQRTLIPEKLPEDEEDESIPTLEEDEPVCNLPENLLLCCYSDNDDYHDFVSRIRPDVVIMYETDLAFIRALELYSHYNPEIELNVTLLVYAESVEEQLQLLAIRQEKEAFENLIKIKSRMAPMIESTTVEVEEEDDLLSNRYLGMVEEMPRTLIVDMRELRSSLPFVLYKHNFILEPLTIDIGDYILTPDICVERKSTSDLIQSLNSGRLYTQAEQMCRNYAKPILLIEFDESKPFSLLPHGDLRADISISDVASKLCLLLLHFPSLRLVWSPSLSSTAELFREMKRDQPEPTLSGDGGSEGADPVARDLLLAMPGVNRQNCHYLMRHTKNIRELCGRTKTDLEELLGAENASKLYNFLHEPINKL